MNEPKVDFALPQAHLDSLKRIESDYFWFSARVEWAKNLIYQWFFSHGVRTLNYVDLGCGTGGFAREISSEFEIKQALLVDGDPKVIHLPSRFSTLKLDLNHDFTLPWAPTLVTCMDVLEHIEQDQKFLDRIHDQMAHGGLLILSVPAHPFLYSKWDKNLGHYRRYQKKDLLNKLKKSGLEVTSARYMWSFLVPMALLRVLKTGNQTEFPNVPSWVNQSLIALSRLEWRTAPHIPFGTSIVTSAIKR